MSDCRMYMVICSVKVERLASTSAEWVVVKEVHINIDVAWAPIAKKSGPVERQLLDTEGKRCFRYLFWPWSEEELMRCEDTKREVRHGDLRAGFICSCEHVAHSCKQCPGSRQPQNQYLCIPLHWKCNADALVLDSFGSDVEAEAQICAALCICIKKEC